MGLNPQAFIVYPYMGVDPFVFTGLAAADLSYFCSWSSLFLKGMTVHSCGGSQFSFACVNH